MIYANDEKIMEKPFSLFPCCGRVVCMILYLWIII